jgi:LysM repeat protein
MKSAQPLLFLTCLLLSTLSSASDSLRTETINGKKVIVHKVEQGQTLFSLARKYNTNVNEIKALNPSMTQLQIGMEVMVPAKNVPTTNAEPPSAPLPTATSSSETHVVQQGETLYRIAKLYGVSPQELSDLNKIGSAGIKVGQELKIPQKAASAKSNDSSPAASTAPPVDNTKIKSEKKISASGYPSISESGMGVYDASIQASPFFLVLHKTAPIGTLFVVKNKENGNQVHAKVIGSLKNPVSEATVVAVNKLVFDKLEVKAGTFPVELFYTPEE